MKPSPGDFTFMQQDTADMLAHGPRLADAAHQAPQGLLHVRIASEPGHAAPHHGRLLGSLRGLLRHHHAAHAAHRHPRVGPLRPQDATRLMQPLTGFPRHRRLLAPPHPLSFLLCDVMNTVQPRVKFAKLALVMLAIVAVLMILRGLLTQESPQVFRPSALLPEWSRGSQQTPSQSPS